MSGVEDHIRVSAAFSREFDAAWERHIVDCSAARFGVKHPPPWLRQWVEQELLKSYSR